MSFILLGILNSQVAGVQITFWLATAGDAALDNGNSVSVDSEGLVSITGLTASEGAGGSDALLINYDQEGTIQWQRILGGATTDESKSVAVDSANNRYIVGLQNSEGAGNFDWLLAKYNSSGTIQFQRMLGGAGDDRAFGVAVGASDDLYVVGQNGSEGNTDFQIAKYNSSGTIQFQRILGGAGVEAALAVGLDSSDNLYFVGRTTSEGAGSADAFIAKYNSSGTIQFQRILGGAAFDMLTGIAVDSSGDFYATGFTFSEGAGSADILIAKYNSSGTIQWQRILGGAGDDRGNGVSLDASGNVYIVGTQASEGEGLNDVVLAKYNSSGTIQFQRVLGVAGFDAGNGIKIDSQNSLYFTGALRISGDGANNTLLGKLPSDGSLTGTYSINGESVVYAAATLTAGTSTLTAGTSSLTAGTSTLTDATSTLTAATSTLDAFFVQIGG